MVEKDQLASICLVKLHRGRRHDPQAYNVAARAPRDQASRENRVPKPAITRWQVEARVDGRTRLMLEPHTGRTHQLRVHCAIGLSAPIVGDRLYGRAAAPRLLLHAAALAFTHPHTGARLSFDAPAPF